MYTNIKDHFLVILIKNTEYMRVNYKYIPLDIRSRYNLNDKVLPNAYIYRKDSEGYVRSKVGSYLSLITLEELS